MKTAWPILSVASLLFLLSPPSSSSSAPRNPAGSLLSDGQACIGCVLMVSIVEQLVQVHNSTTQKEMERLCSYLPEKLFLKSICYLMAEVFGPDIVKLLSLKMNPDVVCHAFQFCKQEPGQPFCHLYRPPQGSLLCGARCKVASVDEDARGPAGQREKGELEIWMTGGPQENAQEEWSMSPLLYPCGQERYSLHFKDLIYEISCRKKLELWLTMGNGTGTSSQEKQMYS